MYGGTLPATGAGLMIFGHSLGLDTAVLIAVVTVVLGILLWRWGARAYDRVS